MTKEELRAQIISAFDIARQEGMVNSKDGKHSLSSEADADDVFEFLAHYYSLKHKRYEGDQDFVKKDNPDWDVTQYEEVEND